MKLINRIKQRRLLKKSPVEYYRSIGVKIGDGCEIYRTASFGSEPYLIEIGNSVRISSGVNFITHDGGVWVLRNLRPELKNIDIMKKISIGNNVHIGINATIMPGVAIGNNCIVACGAIVTKNVPDNSIVAGIPARVIETIDEYEKKNEKNFLNIKNMPSAEKQRYLIDFFNKG